LRFRRAAVRERHCGACDNLKIEGVPLYPGTKHSTATDFKRSLGVERARETTGHSTKKAFKRYIEGDTKNLRALNAYAGPDKGLTKDFCPSAGVTLLKFKGKNDAEGGI
jgi:hypothetical protein